VSPHAIADAIAALAAIGGLGGIASVLTSLTALRRHRDTATDIEAQMRPNHGTSMRDAIDRIEHGLDDLRDSHQDLSRRLGAELGALRRQSDREHADYDARLRHLEHHHAD